MLWVAGGQLQRGQTGATPYNNIGRCFQIHKIQLQYDWQPTSFYKYEICRCILLNFPDIKFPFIKMITKNKRECGSFSRIITGFPYDQNLSFQNENCRLSEMFMWYFESRFESFILRMPYFNVGKILVV